MLADIHIGDSVQFESRSVGRGKGQVIDKKSYKRLVVGSSGDGDVEGLVLTYIYVVKTDGKTIEIDAGLWPDEKIWKDVPGSFYEDITD